MTKCQVCSKKKATTSCWPFLFIYVEEKNISFSTVTYVTISLLHWYSQDGKLFQLPLQATSNQTSPGFTLGLQVLLFE